MFNAAISPTARGDGAVVNYTVSGSTERPQIRARGRHRGQQLGTMGDELTLARSSTVIASTNSVERWGDYAGATPDPAAPDVVWGTNELSDVGRGGGQGWTAQNFALKAPDAPPTVSITSISETPSTGEPVTFQAAASDVDGTVASIDWDLDADGAYDDASGATATRSFARAGRYEVAARATDEAGLTATAQREVTIQNRAPVAVLATSPIAPQVGEHVQLDASGSRDPDGTIARYRWDLDGDGSHEIDTGASSIAETTYSTPGKHTVGVRVEDDDGAAGEAALEVVVEQSDGNPLQPPPPDGRRTIFPAQPGTSPPGLRLAVRAMSSVRLAAAARRGVALRYRCSRACAVDARLLLGSRAARALGLPPRALVLSRAAGRAQANVDRRLALRLFRRTLPALKRRSRTVVTLVVAARTVGAPAATTNRGLVLRR